MRRRLTFIGALGALTLLSACLGPTGEATPDGGGENNASGERACLVESLLYCQYFVDRMLYDDPCAGQAANTYERLAECPASVGDNALVGICRYGAGSEDEKHVYRYHEICRGVTITCEQDCADNEGEWEPAS